MHTCNIILYFFLYLRMSKESLYQPISQQKYTMKFNYSCIFKLDCGFFFKFTKQNIIIPYTLHILIPIGVDI